MQNDRSATKLSPIFEFLLTAPEHQVKRLKLAAYQADLAGERKEAISTLRSVILDEQDRMHPQLTESGRYWHCELREFVDQMEAEHGSMPAKT